MRAAPNRVENSILPGLQSKSRLKEVSEAVYMLACRLRIEIDFILLLPRWKSVQHVKATVIHHTTRDLSAP